jgi:hypothetical protein
MRASERFFSGVREFVRLQMTLGDELLIALIAHERSFSCVSPHVSF